MALGITYFNFYTDDTLTSLANQLTLEFESDLSDAPKDVLYYFGSAEPGKKLETAINPGVNEITLTPTYILPKWEASKVYALGDSVIPDTPNGYRYEVTTAGTSGAIEPAWGVIMNGNTLDNGIVWRLVAEDSPITEIKMALSLSGLDTAIAGEPLTIGNTVLSGAGNAIPVYVRVTNTITQVSESLGTPELGININQVKQSSV